MREDRRNNGTTEYSENVTFSDGDKNAWSERFNRRAPASAPTVTAKHKVKAIVLVLVFAVLAAITVMFTTQSGYAIYMNGEAVGTTKDIDSVEAAVQSAEDQASEILGYDYSVRDSIELEPGRTAATGESTGTELENAILENIEGIAKLYALKLDGEIVAACEDAGTIDAALNAVLDRYTSKDTTSASFVQNVSISLEFVREEFLCDGDQLLEMLLPEDGSEPILSVERTDRVVTPVDTDFEHIVIYDDTVYEGTDTLLVAGIKGLNKKTEQVHYLNGEETDRILLEEALVIKPMDEVRSVGTKERPFYMSYGEYIWPTDGIITSYFGYREPEIGSTDHKGLDIAGYSGQDILAADGGEVIYADWLEGYGYLVKILHDNGDVTYYGHCSELLVYEGEKVGQGELIAYMGCTGIASGDHLHFEIRRDDVPINPLDELPDY